jgi:pseudouridine synthase
MMDKGSLRLQKFLSQAGVCSRRQAERLMLDGRVRVNGQVAREMGTHVTPGVDRVEVDGEEIENDEALIYLIAHKPTEMITSLSDPEGRPVIADLLPPWASRARPVGRLDWNSDGLMIMTNDGELAHLMTHPSTGVEKIYHVKVKGVVEHQAPELEQLREGVTLDDGYHTSRSQVEVISDTGQYTWLEIILHEGHNRQIRRMCEAVGFRVQRLRRVAIGPLELGDLPARSFRLLTKEEVNTLYDACGSRSPKRLDKRMISPPRPKEDKPKRRGGKKKPPSFKKKRRR